MDTASLERLIRTVTEEVVKALASRQSRPRGSCREGQTSNGSTGGNQRSEEVLTLDRRLLSEQQIEALERKGCRRIVIAADALVTPLAADRARDKGIEIVRSESSPAVSCAQPGKPQSAAASRKLAVLAVNTNQSERESVIEAARICGFATELEPAAGRTGEAVRDAAVQCAHRVANGHFDRAVIIDESAFSLAKSLARLPGIRASVCWDVDSAIAARNECDCNVLVLSNRILGMTMLRKVVTAWLREQQ
jgi:ribose 5-phosphate isomerase RpiB